VTTAKNSSHPTVGSRPSVVDWIDAAAAVDLAMDA
jgi:hypothetical protein